MYGNCCGYKASRNVLLAVVGEPEPWEKAERHCALCRVYPGETARKSHSPRVNLAAFCTTIQIAAWLRHWGSLLPLVLVFSTHTQAFVRLFFPPNEWQRRRLTSWPDQWSIYGGPQKVETWNQTICHPCYLPLQTVWTGLPWTELLILKTNANSKTRIWMFM